MISHLDHLVLTTHDIDACKHFYTRVLGMYAQNFGNGRLAFHFGGQKINVHERGQEIDPKAHLPVPGALDLCFVTNEGLERVMEQLNVQCWPILEGPVSRTGANGPIRSIYVRDPDFNLIEIAEQL